MDEDLRQHIQSTQGTLSLRMHTLPLPVALRTYLGPFFLFTWLGKNEHFMEQQRADQPVYTSPSSTSIQPPDEPDTKDGAWQAELVARCLHGDESAFATLSDQYGTLLLRTAYLVIGDEDVAQDIVQDTLILAWRKLSTLREPWHLRAWLLKITLNQSMGLKRQFARRTLRLREQFAQQTRDTSLDESEQFDNHLADKLDIARAVERLPVSQRAVLVLFYYHRMSMPEIAAILGVAENTLRKRLQSALAKVRRVLTAESLTSSTAAPTTSPAPPYFPPTRLREGDTK